MNESSRSSRPCPMCEGSMERGFLIDRGHGNAPRVSSWVEGPPEHSFWLGLKLRGKSKYRVSADRCGRCGYLALFADERETR